ncbi:unnamed protein product, partial [marine sediment metagenome]
MLTCYGNAHAAQSGPVRVMIPPGVGSVNHVDVRDLQVRTRLTLSLYLQEWLSR